MTIFFQTTSVYLHTYKNGFIRLVHLIRGRIALQWPSVAWGARVPSSCLVHEMENSRMRPINCVVLIWAWNPGSPLRVTGARLLSQTGGTALCCPRVIKKNTFTACKNVRSPLCASFWVFVLSRPLMDGATHSQKNLPHSVHWDKCQYFLKCLSSTPRRVFYQFFKGSLDPVMLTAMISYHTSAKRPFTVYLLLMSSFAFRPHILN